MTISAEKLKKDVKKRSHSTEDIQDSNNLLEAARSIGKVATVTLGGVKYEQHEKWGEDARHYFAGNNNSNDTEEFARQLSLQLKILHDSGIVHYDLKPENILVKKEDGKLKLRIIDFDLSYDIKKPKPIRNFDVKNVSGSWEKGKLITSFSGRSDSLPQGAYQKVNDMKGYLYTLSQISTDDQRGYYQTALEYLTAKYVMYRDEHPLCAQERFSGVVDFNALDTLYKQGFGEMDNVDLFVRFCHSVSGSQNAFLCYSHFREDPSFTGQGQPIKPFEGELDGKIKLFNALITKYKSLAEAKKYYNFINQDVKDKLLKEINDDGTFNEVGLKRLDVIGLSIDIHTSSRSLTLCNKSQTRSIKDKLLNLHVPQHQVKSLESLATQLKSIKTCRCKVRELIKNLENVDLSDSSTNGPSLKGQQQL